MPSKSERQATIDDARDQLRTIFPQGSTVTTVVRYVSQSGMRRAIMVLAPTTMVPGYGDDPHGVSDLSWLVARAIDGKLHRNHGGVQVDGAGMDMTFHLVYTLAQVLYGDGYALKSGNLY